MDTENLTQHIETASANWKPSRIEGVEYLSLRTDRADKKGTFLYRMGAGTCYTRHRHPAGEEMLLLKGSLQAGDRTLRAGDFLYSPPGSVHELKSEKGCMYILILPKPMEIVAGGNLEEMELQFETNSVGDPAS